MAKNSTDKAPVKAAAKKTTKPAEDAKDTISQVEFLKRFKKATKGKDLRHVAREINNDFPQYRTMQLINRVTKMSTGELVDLEVLEAIEKI